MTAIDLRLQPPATDETVAATALGSGDPADLAHITEPSIALTLWWRPQVVVVPAEDLSALTTIRLKGDPDDAEASILDELAATPPWPWHAALARDIGLLGRRFADIADCDEIALRLDLVEGDACHRFHADYVPLRLITTYAGRGTEWRRAGDPESVVHHMQVGHVGLFKGRQWGPVGLLHRSPPIAGTGERRLVLVIDALRPNDDHVPGAAG